MTEGKKLVTYEAYWDAQGSYRISFRAPQDAEVGDLVPAAQAAAHADDGDLCEGCKKKFGVGSYRQGPALITQGSRIIEIKNVSTN
jgi:hypothetical protein